MGPSANPSLSDLRIPAITLAADVPQAARQGVSICSLRSGVDPYFSGQLGILRQTASRPSCCPHGVFLVPFVPQRDYVILGSHVGVRVFMEAPHSGEVTGMN